MENNFLLTDEILWDYSDGLLTPEETTRVEAYLRQHPEWQVKVDAIEAEKRSLFAHTFEKPDRGFADRVLAAWATEQVQAHAMAAEPVRRDWIIRGIAIAFGVFVLTPVVVLLVMALQSAPVSLPQVQMPVIETEKWTNLLDNSVLQLSLLSILALLLLRLADQYLHRKLVTG